MSIYSIAEKAGVSPATVSRVLNNKSNVSEKTRQKVMSFLKEEERNSLLSSENGSENTSRTIGVLTTDIRNLHYTNIVYAIEQECSSNGYTMALYNTGNDSEYKTRLLCKLAEKKVDGIIMIGSIFNDKEIEASVLHDLNHMPVVFANGLLRNEHVYSVLTDAAYGISLCVKHLADTGRKKIIFVKDSDTYSANEKLRGYKESMDISHLPYSENTIIKTTNSLEGGFEAVERLLADKIAFDALVCCEDITALGCQKALHHHGIKIPEQAAVTGCNNSLFAQCAYPVLTTVDNKVSLLGKLSFQLLSDLIEKREVSSNLLIRPDLVIGKSS